MWGQAGDRAVEAQTALLFTGRPSRRPPGHGHSVPTRHSSEKSLRALEARSVSGAAGGLVKGSSPPSQRDRIPRVSARTWPVAHGCENTWLQQREPRSGRPAAGFGVLSVSCSSCVTSTPPNRCRRGGGAKGASSTVCVCGGGGRRRCGHCGQQHGVSSHTEHGTAL